MHSALRLTLLAVLSSSALASLQAQNADSATTARAEDVLVRVRRHTSNDVAAARALVDSLVVSLPVAAAVMPEALFAKASIAPSAIEAERDYTRIVKDYRFSARVPDALMRLAVLESARNNRFMALRHLERLLRDHSDAPVRSRASLLAGRLRLDENDRARACELLAAAHASAGVTERDVKEQAESLGAKCPTPIAMMAQRDPPPLGVARAARVTPAPVVAASTIPATRRNRRDSTALMKPTARDVGRDSASTPKPVVPVIRGDTAPRVVVPVVRRDTAAAPKPVTPVVRRDTAPTPKPAAPVVRSEPTAAPLVASGRFGVQFAAYNDRPSAEQFASVLRAKGIVARVEGAVGPFRVRAGRFATRAEAEASAALWRRPGQPAIVVALGPTP